MVKLLRGGEGEGDRERPMSALETAWRSLERGDSDNVSVVAVVAMVGSWA